MDTQISKGERTRLEIMKTALELFSRQGYHGTSMRQIAEQAEIALGGIYNHFSSKEEIYQAVVLEYHPINYGLPNLEQIEEETIEQYVRRAARQVYTTVTLNQNYLNLMFVELVEFRGRHLPGLLKQVFPRSLEFARNIREKQGKLREIPLPIMVITFVGLIFLYVFFNRFFQPEVEHRSKQEGLDQIFDIFLYGILEKETEA